MEDDQKMDYQNDNVFIEDGYRENNRRKMRDEYRQLL